ncbi:MAG: DUF1836 domain-containing protein [Oscillospiraceae bacterium]|nr:DUF1836 domain-containing protein [Oscillospiraceae bacterium]
MKTQDKQLIADSVRHFRLPRYEEIPTVGLYLEQVTKYIGEYLDPIQEGALTASMISNYVKKHLIESPVKKQYSRDQIAYLIFIAVAKNALSLDALMNFIHLQQRTYTAQRAYDYFCQQFEHLLRFTFELTDTVELDFDDASDEKRLLYSCIVAVTQKLYLEKCLAAIAKEEIE